MREQDLAAAMRRHQPASLKVLLADGTVRDLAPPGGRRKRWSHVVATLEEYQWISVELLNAKSQVLTTIANDAPPDDLEDLDSPGPGGAQWYVNGVLRGQDVVLRRHVEHTSKLTDAVVKLASVTVETLQSVQRLVSSHLEVVKGLGGDGDGDGDGALSGAAMGDLIQLLAARNAVEKKDKPQ